MNSKTINYSQCWEDPRLVVEALALCPDDTVLSITSGGDNTLAILLAGPRHVVSVDLNPAQNHVLELKQKAAIALSYAEYLEFLGVTASQRRGVLFEKVSEHLSPAAREWWSGNPALIKRGAIHCGRFERFSAWFATYVLPFIHSRKTIASLLSCRDLREQQLFYANQWDSKRWRIMFALASSRLMLRRYARQHGMFAYTGGGTVAEIYRRRLARHLASVSVQGNFFLQYSLTGRYGDTLPPYLQESGYSGLRSVPESALSITTDNVLDYLRTVPSGTFSKFNLSDIFEALSGAENEALWKEIVRTAKPGAIVAYWNNLVQRSYPASVSARIATDDERLNELRAKDRVFFYDSFHVHTILA